MLHHGSDLYCGYRLLVLVWASGKHQLSKSFQKKAFLIFLPERGITAAQTKHQIQSWSTSKLPLLYLLSVLRHHSLHTPSTASPNCSPRPFLDLVLLLFFFYPLIINGCGCFTPPPPHLLSLCSSLFYSVCGLLLNRRSSTGNRVRQTEMLIHGKRRRKRGKVEERNGIRLGVGEFNNTIIAIFIVIVIIIIAALIKPSYISNQPWMFAARNNVHLLSNLAIIQACQTTII